MSDTPTELDDTDKAIIRTLQLDGRTPIDDIRRGQAGVVADLAQDMLTGSPV